MQPSADNAQGQSDTQVFNSSFIHVEYSASSSGMIWTAKPRQFSLIFEPLDREHYKITLAGMITGQAILQLSLEEINAYVDEVRTALAQIIDLEAPSELRPGSTIQPYLQDLSIPEPVYKETLKILADAGYSLYHHLFTGENQPDPRAGRIGKYLRYLLTAEPVAYRIQMVADQLRLPWGILYLGASLDIENDDIDPNMFLGIRHIVEHRPLTSPDFDVVSPVISSDSGLRVGLNVNREINGAMPSGRPWVDNQVNFWKNLEIHSNIAPVTIRSTKAEVLEDLAHPEKMKDEFAYFICHAGTDYPPKNCWIKLTDGEKLTLGEIQRKARAYPANQILSGRPLVFLNACQTAQLSPSFYNGFVPYLLNKGARGVIGTECEVPTIFAVEWADSFFEDWLEGKLLGEVLWGLRRRFMLQHRNLLGLVYTAYCDSDLQIFPAVLDAGMPVTTTAEATPLASFNEMIGVSPS
jgi:CHAT domain-containing protein